MWKRGPHRRAQEGRKLRRRDAVGEQVAPPPPPAAPRTPDDTSWDEVASWYDALVGEKGSAYQQDTVIPGALRLLAPRAGERVLDLACGQGVFCRALHKLGVSVTGVDASERLIGLARSRSSRDIRYEVADARQMAALPRQGFDAAACLLAIENIDAVGLVFAECARVLRPGGRLVLVMTHPCFRIPRQSGWGWDEGRHLQYRRVDSYLSEMKVPIQMHPGADPSQITWTFHRPMQAYVQALAGAGLLVEALEEWPSKRVSKPGPQARAENRVRAEIPLFLAVKAVRVDAPAAPPEQAPAKPERPLRRAMPARGPRRRRGP
ncbi:MAG: class I SAM-dependent methyltransferase [Dehalococcoidia bacterium]|nr:class I SAM-dependent methyltransferase [Dehalococcoidia bacterium]